MALITCPECGKEVSDKASACVHCGYPIQKKEEKYDISNQLSEIRIKFNSFLNNPFAYRQDFASIFADIKFIVDNIKSSISNCSDEQKINANNELTLIIHSAMVSGYRYCGWKTNKSYYELIDFTTLSDNILAQMTTDMINLCDMDNTLHIMLWYPISQLLVSKNEQVASRLKNNLSKKSALGTKYTDVQDMVKKHLSENVSTQVMMDSVRASINAPTPTTSPTHSSPRCPTCGSTNIAKISTGKKAVGFAMVGIFSSNLGKTMECKKCGYKW